MPSPFVEFCRETSDVLLSLYSSYSKRGYTLDPKDYHYRQVLRFCRYKAIFLEKVMDVASQELAADAEDEAYARLLRALENFPWEEPVFKDKEVYDSALSMMSWVRKGLIKAVEKRTPPTLADLKAPPIRF